MLGVLHGLDRRHQRVYTRESGPGSLDQRVWTRESDPESRTQRVWTRESGPESQTQSGQRPATPGWPMHTHVTMGSPPEVLSWTSCPGLLVGKLKEELKLSVVGDAMKKTGPAPDPQTPALPPDGPLPEIITDLAPPPPPPPPPPTHLCVPLPPAAGPDEECTLGGVTPSYGTLNEDSSVRAGGGGHFDNSVLQLRDQEEAGQEEAASPASCDHGGCGSGGEEHTCRGRPTEEHTCGGEGQKQPQYHHHHPHPDDIKLHFHRAGPNSGGFLEGLFGCLRPVWNIIGKTYSTDYKLQQQGEPPPQSPTPCSCAEGRTAAGGRPPQHLAL